MARFILLLLLSVLASLSAAIAVQSQDGPPETEAARLYREAMEQWREIAQAIPDPQISNIWDLLGNPERLDPAKAEAFIRSLQPALGTLRKAIDAGDPQFPIRYEDGWNTHLSHIAMMRSLLQPLAMDAHWRMYQGQTSGVGDDIARIFQVGQTLRSDRMIISSLVEVATFTFGSNLINDALGQGALSQQDASTLLQTIDQSIASEDMFGVAEAFETEGTHTAEWMLRVLEEDGGADEILKTLVPSQGRVDGTLTTAALSAAELEAGAHLWREAMMRGADILRIDDLAVAKVEYQRLMDDVENGAYGPVAVAIGPFRNNMVETLIQSSEMIEETRARLHTVASSPDGAKSLLNAAIWYRRAIAEWNRLDPEVRRVILGAGHQGIEAPRQVEAPEHQGEAAAATPRPDNEAPMHLRAALAQAQPIIAIILEASEIERCAFDDSRYRRLVLWPTQDDHVAGMLELGGLIERAAGDALARSDRKAAGPLLKAGMVMCDHLAQDALSQSSEAAVAIFDATASLLSRWVSGSGIEPARSDARTWLARLDESDPFGHRAAIRAAAARVRYAFIERRDLKATLERDLQYLSYRDSRISEAAGAELAVAVREIRESDWPALRIRISEIVAASANDLSAADSQESLAAAEALIAEALEAPDATVIRSIVELFLAPMIESARAAVAADATFDCVRAQLAQPAASD